MDKLKLQCGQVSNGKKIAVYTDDHTTDAMSGTNVQIEGDTLWLGLKPIPLRDLEPENYLFIWRNNDCAPECKAYVSVKAT